MKSMINKLSKSIIILFIVVISTSYVYVIETKSQSDNINKTVNLSTMALKVEEFEKNNIYRAKDTFTGDLTGYVFNCPLCSGRLACKSSYDITDGRDYYDDELYGRVKIVASSSNLPCGSIIRFNSSRVSSDPVVAIVLDRGVRGNSLDLLTTSLNSAYTLGRSVISYDVLRNGWSFSNES